MKKISTKATKRSSRSSPGQEFIVLIEKVRDDVKLTAEQHGTVINKLDNLEGDLIALDKKMGDKFLSHDSAFFKIEMELEMIKSKSGTIDTKVDRIERKLDSALTEHGQRIGKLEEKVGV